MSRLVAAVLVVGFVRAEAAADELMATRNQDLVEAAHTVDVEVKDGLAYYKVRRVFRNRGRRAEEARLTIELPYGAAATGLRIKGKKGWHEGELLHARKAEELYVELTGMGPSDPKDPALLYWRWPGELALRVFPIMPGTSNTVEYTLTAPTTYAGGTHYVTYGRKPKAKNLAVPSVRVRGGASIARVEVDGSAAKRSFRLDKRRLHPVLVEAGIENPRVLVRSMEVKGEKHWKKAVVDVDLRHTWRGDIELSLISPSGSLHPLRSHDLSDGGNDLQAQLSFDYDGDPNGSWHLLVTDHHPLDGGKLDRWSLGSGRPKARVFRDSKPGFIPQPTESRGGLATIGIRLDRSTTALRLGRVDLLRDKQFARFEVDVARKLSKLPRPLSVSFVLDASHTMDNEGLAAQLDVIEAYLSHVPWADVSLVAFSREARSLTQGFARARAFPKLRAQLQKTGALAPGNGSFLDRGIATAVSELAGRKGSRALVLLTDDRLRPTWANAPALAYLGPLAKDATVHVVDVSPNGSFELERDDGHRLMPLARLRNGVAVKVAGLSGAKRADVVREALYLVRPTRLEHVALVGEGISAAAIDKALPEGAGIRWMGQLKRAPRSVELTGQLWSRPVRYRARSGSEPFNRATAGFVFSHDQFDDLDDNEQYVLAMYGGVVSPVTSFLAVEPGVRPSTVGLLSRIGHAGVIGSGLYGTTGRGFSPRVAWAQIIQRAAYACHRHGDGTVDVVLHLQSHEIADIALKHSSGDGARDRCVVEALWRENLPRSSAHPWTWIRELRVPVAGPAPALTP